MEEKYERWRKVKHSIKKNMIAGLLITVPAGLTFLVLRFVIRNLDSAMEPIITRVVGPKGMQWLEQYPVPGVGFLFIVVFIILVGLVATNFFGRKLVQFGEDLLHKIPFVRVIYTSIKKVIDTVSQTESPTFEKMVLLTYPRPPLKVLGIVSCDTRGEINAKIPGNLVNVFIPTSPNPTTGFLIMVPRDEMEFLEMSVEDGLKMIISFGMVNAEIKLDDLPGSFPDEGKKARGRPPAEEGGEERS